MLIISERHVNCKRYGLESSLAEMGLKASDALDYCYVSAQLHFHFDSNLFQIRLLQFSARNFSHNSSPHIFSAHWNVFLLSSTTPALGSLSSCGQSIPPTREFPKTISSIKQTNLWDEEKLLPMTIIINNWMAFYTFSCGSYMRNNYYQGGLPIVSKIH